MKRILCVFVTLILITLTGCSGDNNSLTDTVVSELKYNIMMTTENENLDNGVKSFKYPSLDGSEYGIDYSAVNKMISDTVHSIYSEYSDCESADEFSFDIDTAEVMCATNNLFSIFFSGSLYVSEAAHDQIFAFSVNIDLDNTSYIEAKDIITDFNKLKIAFENGEFLQNYGVDGLTEQAQYADMFVEYREEYGLYPDIYFTPDGIGIVVELVYALGGFASFELPYESAVSFIDTSNIALASVVNFQKFDEQITQ